MRLYVDGGSVPKKIEHSIGSKKGLPKLLFVERIFAKLFRFASPLVDHFTCPCKATLTICKEKKSLLGSNMSLQQMHILTPGNCSRCCTLRRKFQLVMDVFVAHFSGSNSFHQAQNILSRN